MLKTDIMRISIVFLIFCSLLTLPVRVLSADTVHFKNGQTVQGVVKKETDSTVIVDVGAGVFTFEKKRIASVEKGAVPAADAQTSRGTADPEVRRLRAFVAKARVKQRVLARYESELRTVKKKIHAKEQELVPLLRELERLSDVLAQYEPGGGFTLPEKKRFHAAIAKRDKLTSRLKDGEILLGKLSRQEAATGKRVAQAHAEYSQLIAKVEKQYNALVRGGIGKDDRGSFKHVRSMIDRYKADWKNQRVPLRRAGNSYYVEARLNGGSFYTFLVDTGATSLVITRSMADELGLTSQDEIQTMRCTIADGSVVEGRLVYLDSVTVGSMTAASVSAVILEDEDAVNIKPLLGMSYLRNFHFRIDTVSEQLVLQKYQG